MKIITRGQFLKLEKPTIFSKVYYQNGQANISDELNILIISSDFSDDFIYIPLSIANTIDSEDDQDYLDKFIAVTQDSKDVALEFDGYRDGLFESDDVQFAIYDIFDYASLLSVLIQNYNLLQDEYRITIEKVKASK